MPDVVGDIGTTDAGSGLCRPFVSPSICSMTRTGEVSTPTADAFRQHIANRWVLCGNTSIFGDNAGDIGLELLADGRWFNLFPGPSGSTVRGAGPGEEGTWVMDDVASPPEQPFAIGLDISGAGRISTHPVFAASPPYMRLDNNGFFIGNYVLDPSVPVGTMRCGTDGGVRDAGGTDGSDAATEDVRSAVP
jgi:hypothetical protein